MGFPLRIVRPDHETASELYESVMLPQLIELGRSKATLCEYRLHLSRWRQYWDQLREKEATESKDLGNTRIKHPCATGQSAEPLAMAVKREDLIAWRRWLPDILGAKVSKRTLNKHVATLQAILAAGVEHDRLQNAPKVKPLPARAAAAKLYFSAEQVSALYLAADAADWPKGVGRLSPADVWRTCFVMWWNYGFRTQELISFNRNRDLAPLTIGQFHFDAESPHPEGHAENELGWLYYTPQKQKRYKPEPLVLPLNRLAHAHVQMVLRSRRVKSDEPFLPVPQCNRSFYRAWSAILSAARVKPKPSLDGTPRFFLPSHFRKSATTWLNLHRPGIAPFILGHAARDQNSDVSDRHYDNQEMRIVEALTTFPQPTAFEQIFLRGEQQRKLFD